MEHLKYKLLSLDTHNYTFFTSDLRFLSTSYPQSSRCQPLSFSPDGSMVGLSMPNYQVHVKVAKTQKLISVLNGHGNAVIVIQWSQDQRYLCTGGVDKWAIVWELKTQRIVKQFMKHEHFVFHAIFIKKDRVLTASRDG